MSKLILIMGESGSGKTTAMRTLDPATTYYIDCDGKGLSWKGWKAQYNAQNKNYYVTDNVLRVRQLCKNINDSAPHIKTIVIDTLNALMVAEEMRRSKEKTFDKWVELSTYIWSLVEECLSYRDDLVIVITAHVQTEVTESGYQFTRVMTSGRKLSKIVLESKFTTVLWAKNVDGRFVFETQANNSTAKSPLGCFDDMMIDNDMAQVIQALEDY